MEQDKVITIVGLGVVGGSYAIALSKKGSVSSSIWEYPISFASSMIFCII